MPLCSRRRWPGRVPHLRRTHGPERATSGRNVGPVAMPSCIPHTKEGYETGSVKLKKLVKVDLVSADILIEMQHFENVNSSSI